MIVARLWDVRTISVFTSTLIVCDFTPRYDVWGEGKDYGGIKRS